MNTFDKMILQKFYDDRVIFVPKYQELYNKINYDSYEWFKIQYSDVCSHGDKIINDILDEIIQLKDYDISIDEIKYNDEEYNLYLDHILDFYEDYINGSDPDPCWAS
ncbi:hypothetical protein Hokovirus_1_321 [Hokovirus HKV1]|mgnify:CR=1 FL=1|uniref:Uncharacterized protein n=1 Tax=Hokovirus HKV1 TaxID=1977638 RepID=A0A1V0SFE2_9VIRU|nr:hypothetical protein Hokovirus_1_321 [Hokovirus HKV1]